MYIGTLGMQLLFKFCLRIADQVEEPAAIPEDCPPVSGVYPRKSAVNTVNQRVPLLILLCQLVFRAEGVMGELEACPASLPVNFQISDHKCPA